MIVVGIGASAGGIEALKKLLKGLDAGVEAAYIVAQHISPTHVSMLSEILARETDLTIINISDHTPIEAGKIYITPPNYHVQVVSGHLHLTSAARAPSPKPSINVLFESLANEYGSDAMGIILSGTGSDGASGLMTIRSSGGVTIAQEPSTSEYDSMPLSAIESGAADLTLQISDMPGVIKSATTLKAVDEESAEWSSDHSELLNVVKKAAGVDLNGYKRSSMKRRIDRHVTLHNQKNVREYIDLLKQNSVEIDRFVKDVFISVTEFFRDLEVFEALREHLERILEVWPPNKVFRVWIPACATGEEAYTIGILLEEINRQVDRPIAFQIFATDISTQAIDFARRGLYPLHISETLPNDLIGRYFEEEEDGFRVTRNLRSNILFSKHDLIQDPPFSNLDLVSCRNLLIYFNTPLQEQVLMMFNYSLNSTGLLCLGLSESAAKYGGLFAEVDSTHKIYRKKEGLSSLPMRQYVLSKPQQKQHGLYEFPRRVGTLSRSKQQLFEAQINEILVRTLSSDYLVVNQDNQIVFLSEKAQKYFKQERGFASQDLLERINSDISPALRSMLYRYWKTPSSEQSGEQVITKTSSISLDELTDTVVRIRLIDVDSPPKNLVIIVIEELGHKPVIETDPASDDDLLATLNDELFSTRESLQTVIEELETSNEELQGLNEEIMSTNEELQSANEELQTANEEMQSSNEELQTVNDELRLKNELVNRFSRQLEVLSDTTGQMALLINSNMKVEFVTNKFKNLNLNSTLGPDDPVSLLRDSFGELDLERISQLFNGETTRYIQDLTRFNKRYRVNARVIAEDSPETLVVIDFEDITESAAQAEAKSIKLEIASDTINNLWYGVIRLDSSMQVDYMNAAAETIIGINAKDALGQLFYRVINTTETSGEESGFINQVTRLSNKVTHWNSSIPLEIVDNLGRTKLIALDATYQKGVQHEGVILLFRDISEETHLRSERDTALARLKQEEQRRDTVSQHAAVAFFQFNFDTQEISGDQTFVRRFSEQADSDSVTFSEFAAHLPEQSMKIMLEHISTLSQQPIGSTDNFTHTMYVQPDNELRTFKVSGLSIETDGSLRFLGASIDITDEVNAQASAEAAALGLAEQQDRQAQMYAVIGHELRTPAASLSMMLEDLDEGERLNIDLARENIEQLLSVIDTLRAVAQPDRRAEATYSSTRIDELLQLQTESFAPFAKLKNIQLKTDLSKLHFEPLNVQKNLLKQVVTNLTKNALIHSEGTEILIVAEELSTYTNTKRVRVVVEDNGKGIEADAVDKLFQAFVRGSTAAEGTGLGLNICRQIMTGMGGDLRYEPNPSGGSRFIVEFEAKPVDEGEKPAESADNSDVFAGMRVLLAEDNKTLRLLTEKILTKQGATVYACSDGAEALSVFGTGSFDLVLSDIFMPIVDGYELVSSLRKQGFAGKIIGLTAATIGDETRQMVDCGADTVLSKPLSIDRLRSLLA